MNIDLGFKTQKLGTPLYQREFPFSLAMCRNGSRKDRIGEGGKKKGGKPSSRSDPTHTLQPHSAFSLGKSHPPKNQPTKQEAAVGTVLFLCLFVCLIFIFLINYFLGKKKSNKTNKNQLNKTTKATKLLSDLLRSVRIAAPGRYTEPYLNSGSTGSDFLCSENPQISSRDEKEL